MQILTSIKSLTLSFVLTGWAFSIAWAESNRAGEVEKDTIKDYDFPEFQILKEPSRLFDNVPGSVEQIDREQLEAIDPVNSNEVFRQISGVNAVDEEGAGLRANIGIRGLDPARSRNVLVMEDGVPVSLAPYGEPEMYYTPSMDRMRGVEVIKGSGSILYGPQTIGGVVNYLTSEPPDYTSGHLSLQGGEGNYFRALGEAGTPLGDASGINVTLLHKQADGIGLLSYETYDINSRLNLNLNDKNRISFKLGFYNETSNSTYIGLTRPMYESGDYYTLMAPDDRLEIRRYSFSARHHYRHNEDTRLRTTFYAYTTSRNWQRQDFSYNAFDEDGDLLPPPENHTGTVWGDETVENGAVYMQNSTGNRNRTFEVTGIEPRLEHSYSLFQRDNTMNTGMRFHYERAFEQRINGDKKNTPTGTIRDDEVRTGKAFSTYMQNRTMLTSGLSFTAGVRTEWFDYERDIRRARFEIDGETKITDTSVIKGSEVFEIIPGAGLNYNISDEISFFGGVHRGFSPPRVKDAISSEGAIMELDAERSWNYEIGVRSAPLEDILYLEANVFLTDFENQVIPVAEYTGAAGAGLVNAGKTRHQGVEMGIRVHYEDLFNETIDIRWSANGTWLDAYYADDQREIDQVNIEGNRTPYAPEWSGNTSLHSRILNVWEAGITFNYTGKQFADELNRSKPSANGRSGLIPAHSIVDVMGAYSVNSWNTRFTVSVKNLLDERYIASRRPQGIKVGSPRMITAGAKYSF